MPISAEFDRDADAIYVRLSDGARARTVEIDDATYVDVDETATPVGIEFLYPELSLNIQEVVNRYGLHPQRLDLLQAILTAGAPVALESFTVGRFLATTTVTNVVTEGTVAAASLYVVPPVASYSGVTASQDASDPIPA